jgi:hypothetical protein
MYALFPTASGIRADVSVSSVCCPTHIADSSRAPLQKCLYHPSADFIISSMRRSSYDYSVKSRLLFCLYWHQPRSVSFQYIVRVEITRNQNALWLPVRWNSVFHRHGEVVQIALSRKLYRKPTPSNRRNIPEHGSYLGCWRVIFNSR